jgi:maltose alpha-D-glucosyltransferase / alpha-amylase
MRRPAASDLWWKNAIVYCLDVETYMDSNGDGIGDFPGLTSKVDYLAGLGVTCIWLQPFYPTPNEDNGYDVADHYGIDPRLGTFGDFVEFMRTARERGIRVIADLVVNHTSTEHGWFKAARSDRESPFHEFYVWSDTPDSEEDVGLIFPGEEDSTWTWDREAGRYYFHRFYGHQADLNINSQAVRDEIHRVMGFWLELGLSGFRVDAVPFLIEQVHLPGAESEDPHDYLRDLRAFLGRRRGDAALLAEANEPADMLGDYFGDDLGDQMHLLFNFIGNQALYLALVRGTGRPIIDAFRSLPECPPTGQFANFVRNHDELSLDKLSDEEREEVFADFAPDPDMRLFERGIRRRLPTMLEGDRSRMELMYSLMFSLPGIPVLYYGEEIGMGDLQSEEGRDAVRTPMQWSNAASGGFSQAPAPSLVRAVIEDGPFAYEKVNAADQRRDEGSFLNWMERMIRRRREWPVFGWGEWQFLETGADPVIAMAARWEGQAVLVVHNLGPRTRRIRLDLDVAGLDLRVGDPTADAAPFEHLLGSTPLEPLRGRSPRISVEGFGYHWFGRER